MPNSGRVRAVLETNQGRVRPVNQDFVDYREPEGPEDEVQHGWLYILADGAGGMDAGEVASQYATERTREHYLALDGERDWSKRLRAAMVQANNDLRDLSRTYEGNSRMATTMVATVIFQNRAHIANVGDSRAYLWRRGQMKQVTKDQSLVAKLLDEGAITAEEAANHPRKNVILYSLGSEREPKIDLYELTLHDGDRLLVCSDGLTRHVSDEEMSATLASEDPDGAVAMLIDLANQRGGEDNISVGIMEYAGHAEDDRGVDNTQIVSTPGELETVSEASSPVAPAPIAASETTQIAARPRVVPAGATSGSADDPDRRTRVALWFYTAVLVILQIILIFVLWLFFV